MTQKLHNDPIIYRAYRTVRGTYKPSNDDPTTGTLTTDDGVKFPATISYEVAALLKNNPEQLKLAALWKCYFRTRPATLHLRKKEVLKGTYPIVFGDLNSDETVKVITSKPLHP